MSIVEHMKNNISHSPCIRSLKYECLCGIFSVKPSYHHFSESQFKTQPSKSNISSNQNQSTFKQNYEFSYHISLRKNERHLLFKVVSKNSLSSDRSKNETVGTKFSNSNRLLGGTSPIRRHPWFTPNQGTALQMIFEKFLESTSENPQPRLDRCLASWASCLAGRSLGGRLVGDDGESTLPDLSG